MSAARLVRRTGEADLVGEVAHADHLHGVGGPPVAGAVRDAGALILRRDVSGVGWEWMAHVMLLGDVTWRCDIGAARPARDTRARIWAGRFAIPYAT